MAEAVLMPKAGISVESCIIGAWKKKPGDTVAVGDILFDYETDKATFECESTSGGVLLETFFEGGDEVPCLVAVCAVGQSGEDVSDLRPGAAGSPEENKAIEVYEVPVRETPEVTAAVSDGSPISPRAKMLAERLRIDAGDASPTGPRGRIIARDVEALASADKTGDGIGGRVFDEPAAAAAVTASAPAGGTAEYTDIKFTKIRSTIAKSMCLSLNETAQVTNHHSCDASGIMAFRRQCKEAADSLGVSGISLGDIVMYVVCRTLRDHPDMNSHLIGGDTLRRFDRVNLGMAVDTPRGLMVPTIFGADKKSLKELSGAAKELAAMAISGSISPDLLRGATFTVSNLGSLGAEMFTPIINPPQAAILGICGITTKVREKAGAIETYPSLGLSLTYDHRAIDGAPASRFARDLAQNIERFQLLLAL